METWTLLGLLLFLTLQPEIKAQECGMAPLNTRVIGGENATAGAWPWQVSMHRRVGTGSGHICGGTILNKEWVMTAAHCIPSTNVNTYILFFGTLTQSGPNPNEVNRTVSKIIIHPEYNGTTFKNDIALLKLSSNITYSNYIRPACLAANSSLFHNGTLCWATGWGLRNHTTPNVATNVLQEVQIPVIGNNQCACKFGALNLSSVITSVNICAGERGRGTCQGDSGGPLQCKQGNQWIQAGVVSFGIPCAVGIPEAYARVSSFQSWIMSQTSGSSVSFVEYKSTGTDADSSFVCSPGSRALPTELVFSGTILIILLMPLFT